MAQFVELTVPKRYLNSADTGDYTFTVPVFDQDYSIKIAFPDTADGQNSFTGVAFPDYQIAFQLIASETYILNWSGLLEEEKEVFVAFLKSFRNSYQPFTLTHYNDASVIITFQGIIQQDAVQINKNNFDLYSLSLTIII